ncbi:hypothetical protein [Actinomadura parmotrematis]|uniref:DUF3558 domain-containing protein n=1 Tax=Actinomadura parmotrematis TaxID=2864039 RepID=A0ABS7FUB3_9ACTN|nr:hypothetical protein [Actinomadura parmotrematis]MBW8483324.1 hypothetical protein [Actinomadura parmotrematis]
MSIRRTGTRRRGTGPAAAGALAGAAAAALAAGALAGCQVRAGAVATGEPTPVRASTPAQAGDTGAPAAGATAPSSGLPETAGGYTRDHDAERREAAALLDVQNDPPSDGPKYALGPLTTGIYAEPGGASGLGEILVVRAEGDFPDTGAAMTDFTARVRAQGAELTPVDPGAGGGSAGCTTRETQGGAAKAVCYLVDATTLLVVSSAGTAEATGAALARMHPDLRT